MKQEHHRNLRKRKPVTLKTIADQVGLAPCSISAVLNNSPAAQGIPQHTKDRVLRAAVHLKYQPNFAARSLRTRRTHSIAVLTRDLGSSSVASALAGVEQSARARGYVVMIGTWTGDPDSLGDHLLQLRQRGIEGMILVDGPMLPNFNMPVVGLDLDQRNSEEESKEHASHLRMHGRRAANALLDQIEAHARMEGGFETALWRASASSRPTSWS